jgi:hypothetical protein
MFVYIHVSKNYIRKAAREETRLRLATVGSISFGWPLLASLLGALYFYFLFFIR